MKLTTTLSGLAAVAVMLTLSACVADRQPATITMATPAATPNPAMPTMSAPATTAQVETPAATVKVETPVAATAMTAAAAAPAAAAAAAANGIKLTVVKVDSEETASEDGHGTNAVDGNPATMWHTQWTDENPPCPHEIIIELNPPSTIKGFTYLPRQDEEVNGTIKEYEFYVSDDGKEFGQPVAKGTMPDEGKGKATVTFTPVKCGFVKLRALSEINSGPWASAAEIGVVPN